MSNLHLVGLQKGEQEQEKLRLNLYTVHLVLVQDALVPKQIKNVKKSK